MLVLVREDDKEDWNKRIEYDHVRATRNTAANDSQSAAAGDLQSMLTEPTEMNWLNQSHQKWLEKMKNKERIILPSGMVFFSAVPI